MRFRSLIFCLLTALLFCLSAKAQKTTDSTSTDTTKAKNLSFVALPLAFYLPETSLGFGAAGAMNFQFGGVSDSLKKSQVLFGGAYTLMKQILTYANYNLYAKQDRFWLKGEVGYYRYFYFFYGIGPKAKLENEETYEVQFPRIRLDAMTRITTKSYFGFRYIFDYYDMIKVQEGGFFDQHMVAGSDGGSISGIGPLYILDTRDNVYSSRSGYKLEASATLFHKATGSSFNYGQINLDASWFKMPFKNYKHVFGAQIISENQWGNVPFFGLSKVGSPKMMRGYYQGRFTDQTQLAAQVEYRLPLFWNLESVLFASSVMIGKSFSDFKFSQAIPAYGTGLRIVLKEAERLKVRLDAAKGEQWNFYVTFNEAF